MTSEEIKQSIVLDITPINTDSNKIIVSSLTINEKNEDSEFNVEPEVNVRVKLGKVELQLVVFSLLCGVFLFALDQTIVATALPKIATELNSLDKISWVATVYLLMGTSFQPLYGKLCNIFGRKETFLFAILVFELGSLLCGLAPNMTVLIISRAISGLGGGGILSLVFIIISDIVPLEDRGKYQGPVSSAYGVASLAGPLVGGAFTDHVTWRWAFFINLPLGAFTVVIITVFLKFPHEGGSLRQKLARIDYLGATILVASTITILLPLNWGGNEYSWNSAIIISLLCVGAVGYIAFIYSQGYISVEPIAPGHVFKNSTVVACYFSVFFQGMGFYAGVYWYPVFYQVVRGDTATQSGLELVPLIMGAVIASIVVGQVISRTDKISYRLICATGGALMAIGAGLISTFTEYTNRGEQIVIMFIPGLGIGLIMLTSILAAQAIVPYDDVAIVTALLNFFRTTGAIFGVAIASTTFSNALNASMGSIEPTLLQYNITVDMLKRSASMVNILPPDIRANAINGYIVALHKAFISIIPMGGLVVVSSLFITENVFKSH